MKNEYPLTFRITFNLMALILVFFILIIARDFLYPIAFGILLGYLLYPLANFIERKGFPRIMAILVSIILLLVVVGAIAIFAYKRFLIFVDDIPGFTDKAFANIDSLGKWAENYLGVKDLMLSEFIKDRVKGMFEMGGTFLNNLFSTTAGTIFRIGILPVYIFLFLYYRTKLAQFLLMLVPERKKLIAIGVLRDMSVVVGRFMGGMSTVVFVMVFLNFFGLWIVGAQYPLMFGVIAALFNFIPYFGTILGYSIPFLFTLLTGDAPIESVRVLMVFFIAQFTENNILTPNIVGNALNLNPMVIILGVVAGGMLWGLPGMFAVIPFLAMVRLMGEHVEVFKPFAYLLGTRGTRRHALTIENIRSGLDRLKNRSRKKTHQL